MVQEYQSPVRVYEHPFELVMAVSGYAHIFIYACRRKGLGQASIKDIIFIVTLKFESFRYFCQVSQTIL